MKSVSTVGMDEVQLGKDTVTHFPLANRYNVIGKSMCTFVSQETSLYIYLGLAFVQLQSSTRNLQQAKVESLTRTTLQSVLSLSGVARS